MQCPSCGSNMMKPIKLNAGLPARQCHKCQGILIDLLSYREWTEDYAPSNNSTNQKLEEVKDNTKALTCSKCSRIMLKFRMAGSTENKVDVCTYCDEAWLDGGEWELLGSLALQDKLNSIFTDPWQNKIREEIAENTYQDQFKELLGTDEYSKLKEVKKWIGEHPRKDDLIRYLLRD